MQIDPATRLKAALALAKESRLIAWDALRDPSLEWHQAQAIGILEQKLENITKQEKNNG